MKYSLSALLLVLLPTTMGIILGYDDNYGVATNSLTMVACSDGQNGLITKGFNTFGDLPTFPNIASSPAVGSWNSPACGSCWNLTYTRPDGVARSLVVTAIDHAASGFYTSVTALDYVTGGNAVAWGQVDVSAVQIARSACGL